MNDQGCSSSSGNNLVKETTTFISFFGRALLLRQARRKQSQQQQQQQRPHPYLHPHPHSTSTTTTAVVIASATIILFCLSQFILSRQTVFYSSGDGLDYLSEHLLTNHHEDHSQSIIHIKTTTTTHPDQNFVRSTLLKLNSTTTSPTTTVDKKDQTQTNNSTAMTATSFSYRFNDSTSSPTKMKIISSTTSPSASSFSSLFNETAVICAVLKDEQDYVEEWVDYNLGVLKFDHIYMYDNSVDFNLKPWHDTYEWRHRVTLKHYPGDKVQIPAYQECGALVKQRNHTWLFYGDGDEFLVLYRHYNIHDFCSQYVNKGPIAINWRVFGTSGHAQQEKSLPVTLRFVCRTSNKYKKNKRFKSIIRVDHLDETRIDSPHILPILHRSSSGDAGAVKLRDLNGRKVQQGMIQNSNNVAAYIYHYYFKSNQEYVHKRMRGDVFHGSNRYNRDNIAMALKGKDPFGQPLPNGTIFDNTAWKHFVQRNSKYAKQYNPSTNPLVKNLTWSCAPPAA